MTLEGFENAAPADPADLPWTKRHPAVSRALLYGIGGIIVVVAILLLVERRGEDREHRFRILEARLDQFDLLLKRDGSGSAVETVLDEDFADPDLPPRIRQRVLRIRAFVEHNRNDPDAADARLAEAEALATNPVDRYAIRIEKAQVLADRRDATGALALLEEEPPAGALGLVLLRALGRANALDVDGRRGEAAAVLDAALGAIPRPPPEQASFTVWGLYTDFVLSARQTTVALVTFQGAEAADPAPWLRLVALAPDDFEAAVHATERLEAQGNRDEALKAWRHALRLDVKGATALTQQDPTFRRLSEALSDR